MLGDLNSPSPQLQSNTNINKPAQGLDPFGFDFPSTTPSNLQKQSNYINTINVNQSSGSSSSLKIVVGVQEASSSSFKGTALISNVQSQTISQVKFMLAVPKSCRLDLKPQSADFINGFANEGISQEFVVENPQEKQLKIKWKVEYKVGNELKEDTGVTILK